MELDADMAEKKKDLKDQQDEVELTPEDDEEKGNDESGLGKPSSKRGRPAKEPPPPKLWRLEAESPEGMRVTLGRYVTKEEAEPDLERLEEDGFYENFKIIKSKE